MRSVSSIRTGQSAPGGSTLPFSFGPSNVPAFTETIVRLPTDPLPPPPVSRIRSMRNSDFNTSGRGAAAAGTVPACAASSTGEIPIPKAACGAKSSEVSTRKH